MEKVFAQICNPALPSQLGGCGGGSVEQGGKVVGGLISGIVGIVFLFGFLLTLAYLLTGGMQWITSQGDKTALESARNKITHAIMGLVIVASAYAIFKLIGNFFGIELPNIKIPTISGQ
ncbi:MAG: hypothetical protein UW37_C0007G0012 [Candidatus Gottesmanbacteria bacterium GW2011_GWA2_44_17]|uniref:Uncharacterized protein n=3 Tax=Candidatus Gottesmaniibacteriota TaxID=1752720 RepID=A0A0G1LMY5_9BACT|nr:MAG: hypothetical protein UV63_C0019G0027 [Microgenomates group bacterium GW2011_GWC1_43_11]KKT38877.1 MAG: hypothetical protein UW22_C0004G0007 [Candidatus Gottesmanbacteria bacterium GW2011_GWB1_44_11c]KKT47446.1 MAG: hypothetical protein UW37_C0007G0012 [Candidatus Gottesmanbacteria bacterium GW2011_GWA2_44_17]KKT61239.1 MAG: hypothetical protein UW52_C0007G0006 [Candidatus Gottesmanbacteria bacterium GW2011_GWA1_44_24b]HCM82459.1 hypothetical protein [Patescibacteria group bacterium]